MYLFFSFARLALEEVKFLQKQRERKPGISALPTAESTPRHPCEKADADGEKEDLVLQDTFAQETAVTVEDPNMSISILIFFLSLLSFYLSVFLQACPQN